MLHHPIVEHIRPQLLRRAHHSLSATATATALALAVAGVDVIDPRNIGPRVLKVDVQVPVLGANGAGAGDGFGDCGSGRCGWGWGGVVVEGWDVEAETDGAAVTVGVVPDFLGGLRSFGHVCVWELQGS